MSNIDYEKHGAVAVLTLNRPEKLNALSRAMMVALGEALDQIDEDQSLRCVILTGAGERAFCAGTDISELTNLNEVEAHATSLRGQAVCDRIERLRLPVIGAINGIAVGGGCELALACHIRLATPQAEFSLPETRLGIIPGYGGTQRLAREIGRGRALEMMLTSRRLPASEAHQVGLVNRMVEAGQLLNEAEALAHEISELAPLAIRACLKAVTRGIDLPLAEGLALETELFAALFATTDVREGTSAFLEKRKPVFSGS